MSARLGAVLLPFLAVDAKKTAEYFKGQLYSVPVILKPFFWRLRPPIDPRIGLEKMRLQGRRKTDNFFFDKKRFLKI